MSYGRDRESEELARRRARARARAKAQGSTPSNQRRTKPTGQKRRKTSESELDNIPVTRKRSNNTNETRKKRPADPTYAAMERSKAKRKSGDYGKTSGKVTTSSKNGKNKRKKKKKMSLGKKIGILIAAIFVALVVSGIAFAANKFSKMNTQDLDAEALEMNITDEAELSGEGYLNVALLGNDSREGTNADLEGSERTDTIMVASLNQETGEIKIVSVFRDTLTEQDDGSYNKINAAYAYGGIDGTISTLNRNLDLNIQNYVMVNFSALIKIIDDLGGIELTLTDEEVYWTNQYQMETAEITGNAVTNVEAAGTQTLNGVQATSYCRIRYTDGDDYRRAERQREVLQQIALKAKSANILTLNKIIDDVLPMIQTNFTASDILYYAKLVSKLSIADTSGFPFDRTTASVEGAGDSVIADTMESNVIQLHQFLFGADGYTPSSIVTNISGNIAYYASMGGTSDTTTDETQTYTDDTQTYTDETQTYTDPTYVDPSTTDGTYTDTGTTDQTYTDETQTYSDGSY